MPVPSTQTINWDTLVAHTTKRYISEMLHDNVFDKMVLAAFLMSNQCKKTLDGGEQLVEPLLFGKNTTVNSMGPWDTVDLTPQEGVTAAIFNWKMLSGSIVISEAEKLKNAGKSAVMRMLDTKTKQLKNSFIDKFTTQFFSDGTGNGGKDITGLEAMISNSGIYGNIDAGTHTWWQAVVNSAGGAMDLAVLRTIYNTIRAQQKSPSLVLGTQPFFEWYEAQLHGKLEVTRQGSNSPLGDLGFQTLQYKGTDVTYDEQCPTGTIYLLNSEYMNLVVHSAADMKPSEWDQPVNQWAYAQKVLWMGNLTTGERRKLAKITGRTF